MDLRKISQTYSVSPQIDPSDVPAIADAGFKSVMCNRPDGEEMGQPEFEDIAQAALAAGIEIRWVPITSGGVSQDDLQQFRAALDEMPGPMLAYCRTGTRCTMLWTITQFGTLPDDEILSATTQAGYDMAGLLQQLKHSR